MHWLPILLLAVLAGTGCVRTKDTEGGATQPKEKARPAAKPQPAKDQPAPAPVIEPVSAFSGKVVLVNTPLKYLVVEGTIGRLPPVDQKLNVYREGRRVGEALVSGQSRGANFAADITLGEARVGDTVRSD